MASILRVFPRKTHATPDDIDVAIGQPTREKMDQYDEAHVSVTWTYDIPASERIADKITKRGLNVKIGGPAYGDRMSGTFVPGEYVKHGYTFTSRGCPNLCSHCSVADIAKGRIVELPITDGWNILDDNLLATSNKHFSAVMDMLRRQERKPAFTGGLEARKLTQWHADQLRAVKTARLYCAYDTPSALDPLIAAGIALRRAGFTPLSHVMAAYVLIRYMRDTLEAPEKRIIQTEQAGFVPYAMLYRDEAGIVNEEWRSFQREWCRPQIVCGKFNQIWHAAADAGKGETNA